MSRYMATKRVQQYRKRIWESKENNGEFKKPKMSNAERQRNYRQRLKHKAVAGCASATANVCMGVDNVAYVKDFKHDALEEIDVDIEVKLVEKELPKAHRCIVFSKGRTTMSADGKIFKQGAEARLYTCTYLGKPTLIKDRFQKTYRHPDLDTILTKERIKSEARAIVKCKSANIRTPTIYLVDFDRRSIYMEHFVNSITVKSFIIDIIVPEKLVNDGENERRNCLNNIARKIGGTVGKMHKNHIIHGDLTTSNILLSLSGNADGSDWKSYENSELVMIDFGLSHIVSNSEDKGVDLYVLERALISTHNDLPDLFSVILEAYKQENKSNISQVLEKFEEVRARGRKRTMVG